MTEQELAKFARFIGQPVAVARKIIEQEDSEKPGVHDGYDYNAQQWIK